MPKKLTCPDDKAYKKIISFSGEVVKMWRQDGCFPIDGKEMDVSPKPVKVTFSVDLADCRCLGKIEGGNSNWGISLRLPTRNWRNVTATHWGLVEPFVAGIIMHEYVHCLQRQDGLEDEIDKSENDGKICKKCKTPSTYLSYYTGLIEKDAHAAGIAVEVMQSCGST